MNIAVNDAALDRIFRTARTYRRGADAWLDRPVEDALLREAYDLAKLGPTSANCQPLRVVFVRSPEAKAELREALSEDNVAQTMAAPVTAIVAADHAFVDHLPRNRAGKLLRRDLPNRLPDTPARGTPPASS